MSRSRNVPGWAKAPRIELVEAKPNSAPGVQPRASSTIAETRARANAERLADPTYQQQQAEQAAQREQQRKLEQARIEAMAPTLIVDIVTEDGQPLIIDGQRVQGRVKAQAVQRALDMHNVFLQIPPSKLR